MSNKVKLLTEWSQFIIKEEAIKDSIEKHGKLILKGVIQKADTLNQNGRIYPISILEREIVNYQKLIQVRAMIPKGRQT